MNSGGFPDVASVYKRRCKENVYLESQNQSGASVEDARTLFVIIYSVSYLFFCFSWLLIE